MSCSAALAADAGALSRALFHVIRNATFQNREVNPSFVPMEYFAYFEEETKRRAQMETLRGYDFWLNKLNAPGGNYLNAEKW